MAGYGKKRSLSTKPSLTRQATSMKGRQMQKVGAVMKDMASNKGVDKSKKARSKVKK